jgi:hypothetical protein
LFTFNVAFNEPPASVTYAVSTSIFTCRQAGFRNFVRWMMNKRNLAEILSSTKQQGLLSPTREYNTLLALAGIAHRR